MPFTPISPYAETNKQFTNVHCTQRNSNQHNQTNTRTSQPNKQNKQTNKQTNRQHLLASQSGADGALCPQAKNTS